jgi:choline dehydrogenase-like flavoprotein
MAEAPCDVVIVGAGLGGAVAALRLAQAGLDVVCLEQGERPDPAAYPGDKPAYELLAETAWHPSPNVRRNAADYPIIDGDAEMKPLLFNGVGGGTVLYGGHWMRLLPSDFRVRSLDGVADDWPLGYRDLAPYYDRADADFGASGVAGDPAYPDDRPDYPLPPLPIGPWGERVAAAHNRLGWHWWPGSNAIASRPYRGRRPCVQRGTCGTGCNEGAKASVDRTHWPEAERLGARLVTGARVARVETDRLGRATGVLWRDRAGAAHRQTASAVVLAAGAIGTPRLLLMSAEGGLANRSGLVGRRLMMHPFARVVGLFDEPMRSWQGHWGQSLYSLEFAETDTRRGFVRGAKWNLTPAGGPLAGALFPWPGEPAWGAKFHDHVRDWLGHAVIWGISCEDLPEAANRVELDPAATDGDGLPAPRLTYRVDENARRMLAFNSERAAWSLEAAGARRTLSPGLMPGFGWHPLGTCRMGTDPDRSVTDADGACHGIPNLWIADGSLLVTGGSVNPAATIAALALRAAERLLARRRQLDVAA